MQKGRVGREEEEGGSDVSERRARGGFDHWVPGNDKQQRTHAVGRWHQAAGVTLCNGGIRDITGIRGRGPCRGRHDCILDACGRRSGPPNLIVNAPSLTGQLDWTGLDWTGRCDYLTDESRSGDALID